LAGLLILAAFFAGSETALMSLNRYRLRHSANEGHRGARLAEALLAHPDRLIGLILLLSTIVNVAAPMLVGFIALRLGGEFLVAFGAAALTLVLLIFCEVAPKTFGALHPERLALPAAYVYTPLLLLLYPFVWATNLLANGVLRLFGVEFLEQRRIAHRRGGGRRDDSASPPTNAGEHFGSGKCHRGGHHGAA
jgi:Mg2+/Co2+ transporter CorB